MYSWQVQSTVAYSIMQFGPYTANTAVILCNHKHNSRRLYVDTTQHFGVDTTQHFDTVDTTQHFWHSHT